MTHLKPLRRFSFKLNQKWREEFVEKTSVSLNKVKRVSMEFIQVDLKYVVNLFFVLTI